MKNFKFLLILTIVFSCYKVQSQINLQDSSVQVISYWNLGDKYEYAVSLQNLRYTDVDTTTNETMNYDVEVTVIDSTTDSYTVKWFYKNFKSNTTDPLMQKIATVADDIAVDIKLDELGAIQSVENWEEVRDYMAKAIDTIKGELENIPEFDQVLNNMKAMYSTKASIEASAIQDAQQFHNFHGAKYIKNDTLSGVIQTPNLHDITKPFDTYVAVMLENIDTTNIDYTLRSFQEVDSEQLTESTYNYLSQLFESSGQAFIKREEMKAMTNFVETVSRIHNTGWVIESTLWKEVISDGITAMEIRNIQMK